MVTLHWRAEQEMEGDYTIFVHLLDGEGHLVSRLRRAAAGRGVSGIVVAEGGGYWTLIGCRWRGGRRGADPAGGDVPSGDAGAAPGV